jgi:hypothetical protein
MNVCYNISVWWLISALDQGEHIICTRFEHLEVILEMLLWNLSHRIRP